nr:hypothetical protein [Tanacetum cinerariifolium]
MEILLEPTSNKLLKAIETLKQGESINDQDLETDLYRDFENSHHRMELEAHYMYMTQIQEVTPNVADNSGLVFDTKTLHKEQGDTNITIDSLDMCNNGETVDQDEDDLAKEHDLLASLIEKLKCEIDDSKNRNMLLESSNKALVDK